MRKFSLKTNDGEVIYKIEAYSLSDAIETFSKIKHLAANTLLNIFKIEEE